MLNAGSQMALVIFAVQAACILVVARAGHFFGVLGAIAAAISLWIAVTAVLHFALYEPGSQVLHILALSVATVFLFPFLPMLMAGKFHWLKGRILLGLVAAAVIAWLISPNTISTY